MSELGRDERARAVELARRINLLLDVVQTETGEPYSIERVQEELGARGVKLSRGRWSYMMRGTGSLVTDYTLLVALADVFGVDRSYLLDWDLKGLPARIDAQLELVKSLRVDKISAFAARTLGGPLSPEATRALTQIVDDEMKRQAGTN